MAKKPEEKLLKTFSCSDRERTHNSEHSEHSIDKLQKNWMFKQAIETDAQPTTTRRVKQAFEQVSIKITDVDMVKLVECERERGAEGRGEN